MWILSSRVDSSSVDSVQWRMCVQDACHLSLPSVGISQLKGSFGVIEQRTKEPGLCLASLLAYGGFAWSGWWQLDVQCSGVLVATELFRD